MLYLKRKSNNELIQVWKYMVVDGMGIVYVWTNLGKMMIPSDEYELIFKA